MSKPIDDGGPVFPQDSKTWDSQPPKEGMSLRDWFAGQTLAGLSALDDERTYGTPNVMTLEEWRQACARTDAEFCYRMADAMLAARKSTI